MQTLDLRHLPYCALVLGISLTLPACADEETAESPTALNVSRIDGESGDELSFDPTHYSAPLCSYRDPDTGETYYTIECQPNERAKWIWFYSQTPGLANAMNDVFHRVRSETNAEQKVHYQVTLNFCRGSSSGVQSQSFLLSHFDWQIALAYDDELRRNVAYGSLWVNGAAADALFTRSELAEGAAKDTFALTGVSIQTVNVPGVRFSDVMDSIGQQDGPCGRSSNAVEIRYTDSPTSDDW